MTPAKDVERAHWFDAWLIILIAPVVIAGCVSAPFLGYDDLAHVGHPSILPDVPWYSAFHVTPRSTYFPITLLSYRFDRWFYGGWLPLLFPESGNAPGYRLTSLFLHLASALVLWRIFLRLKAGRWCSLFAAAAWVAHPAACESVAWISERKNVLAALFGFVALWFWCREWDLKRGWLRAPAAACFYLLAVLSKPTAAGFLIVFAAYEILYKPGARAGRRARWLTWGTLLVLLVATGALAWVNFQEYKGHLASQLGGSILNTALTDVEILRLYICNMLLPLWLCFIYHVAALISFADPRLWISAIFLAACVCASLWLAAERRLILFLWCWFLGALLPALNIIPIWQQMQDRYAYFSLPALLLLLALTLAGAARRSKVPPIPRLACWATLGGVAGLAALAAIRSGLYDYDVALYRDALAKQPDECYLHECLGLALNRDAENAQWAATPEMQPKLRQMRKEAFEHLKVVLGNPAAHEQAYYGKVLLASGILIVRLGDAEFGREVIKNSLANEVLEPGEKSIALLALAELALNEGRAQAALDYTTQAAKEGGPASPPTLYWRGRAFEKLGENDKALLAYQAIPQGDWAHQAAAARIKRLTLGE